MELEEFQVNLSADAPQAEMSFRNRRCGGRAKEPESALMNVFGREKATLTAIWCVRICTG
jgi:hypothetical protein